MDLQLYTHLEKSRLCMIIIIIIIIIVVVILPLLHQRSLRGEDDLFFKTSHLLEQSRTVVVTGTCALCSKGSASPLVTRQQQDWQSHCLHSLQYIQYSQLGYHPI
eukprot:5227076-Amphidinium_carterae.1